MKPEIIRETMRRWQEQPEKAKGRPTVKARSDGPQAILEAGPFTWRVDEPVSLGGTDQAPTPTALFLGALASCAVALIHDVLAPQLGVAVEGVEATVQCETDSRGLLGMDGVSPDYRNLKLSVEIRSSEDEAKVQNLYQVWQERCPIYRGLIKPLQVATTLQVKRG